MLIVNFVLFYMFCMICVFRESFVVEKSVVIFPSRRFRPGTFQNMWKFRSEHVVGFARRRLKGRHYFTVFSLLQHCRISITAENNLIVYVLCIYLVIIAIWACYSCARAKNWRVSSGGKFWSETKVSSGVIDNGFVPEANLGPYQVPFFS